MPTPEWALNSTRSGRSMSMADLDDNDGDLDIVVNNLQSSAQLFENQLCTGSSLELDLFWPESGNSRALDAIIYLETGNGRQTRQVKASSGYLSGDPARIHFGFPQKTDLQSIYIQWPDGEITTINNLRANTLLSVTRR